MKHACDSAVHHRTRRFSRVTGPRPTREGDGALTGTYETDVAARKPRAEYTRGLTIVGEAWDYMGNLTEVVYSISSVY